MSEKQPQRSVEEIIGELYLTHCHTVNYVPVWDEEDATKVFQDFQKIIQLERTNAHNTMKEMVEKMVREVTCNDCDGTGFNPSKHPNSPCYECGGTGIESGTSLETIRGFLSIAKDYNIEIE